MNVDDLVQEQIEAARRKTEADRAQRAELAENRRSGVAVRHAVKAARTARQEPAAVRRAHCPACRGQRLVRLIGTAVVRARRVELLECQDMPCGLVWAVPCRTLAAA